MNALYNLEKKKLVEDFDRYRGWWRELEPYMRSNIRPLSDYQGNIIGYEEKEEHLLTPEWDADAEHLKFFKESLEKLNIKYNFKDLSADNLKHMWVMISVNPMTGREITSMEMAYQQLQKLNITDKYIASVEAHTEHGYRPHIHMILYSNQRPNRIIDKISKHFKIEKNFVQCKTSYSHSINLKYLKGDKAKEKQQYVEEDKLERVKHNIPHIIEKL